jgi:hypothetical protein
MDVGTATMDQAMPNVSDESLATLEAQLKRQLWPRVRELKLDAVENGLVLRGQTRSYYEKQLAQHAVMGATKLLIVANHIVVA